MVCWLISYGNEGWKVPLFERTTDARERVVGRSNQLVAGVLITQERRQLETCQSVREGGRSSLSAAPQQHRE